MLLFSPFFVLVSDSSSKRDSNIPNGDLTDENIISLPGVHMNLSKADVSQFIYNMIASMF